MSHFAVLVISNSDSEFELASLLSPYDENMEVAPYVKYTRDEAIATVREETADGIRRQTRRLDDPKQALSDDERERCLKWYKIYKEREHWTDEQCYEYMRSDYPMTDDNGSLLSTYNQKSKWDWWSVGGRFSCEYLRDKGSGQYVDEMWAEDLCLVPDKEQYESYKRWWEINVDGDEPKEGDEKDERMLLRPEYYREFYKNKETYATILSLPIFRAVVTPDGVWHEKGQMGWFAMSSETPEESIEWDWNFVERFLVPAISANNYLTVVDCHI